MKVLLSVAALFTLAACAPPLSSAHMMPLPQVYTQIPSNPELERGIQVGNVSVAEETSSQVAPVTPEVYREALQNAMLTANYATRGGDKGKFILDAKLIALDVPMFGFDMESSATAQYQLKRADNNYVVYSETITVPAAIDFSEAFNANERARIVSARAIRENLTHLVRVLGTKTKAELTKGAAK